MTRVSVCCSVLNQRDLLKDMIHSVREQSFTDWELVLVDDGSTEDIAGLVAEFADERIKLHRFPENKGVPHGMNWALQHAEGEYVSVLSTDERIEPNKLMWQVGYLDEHREIDGLWGLPQNGELGERPEWEQYALKAHNRSREAWVRTLLNLESIPIGGASFLWRRTVLDSIGIFDAEHFTTSDLEWYVRFFEKHEGRVMPYRWAWSIPREDQLMRTVTPEQFQEDLKRVRGKHPLVFPPTEGRVTVAIPVRNMERYIVDTLKSLHAQTFQDFDIVVLDDASTDGTVKVVQEMADDRTKLLQFDENRGPNAAQNHMLGVCETPFFVVLAADDTVEPTFLERCLSEFKRDPWLEFVATQTDFIDETGKPYTADHPFKNIIRAANKPRDAWLQQIYYGNHYFGCAMYRTKAAKDVGGWDTGVGVLGDYDMYLKLLQRENIHVIHENLTHTRIHDTNRSIGRDRKWQLDLRQHYHDIRKRYYSPRLKVILATPFYEMRGFSPYIVSMLHTVTLLTRLGIDYEFWDLAGDSYVERAKNTLTNKFLEDPDATDLFMIDSDMQWNPDAVLRMILLPEEIVMGSYPQKNAWDRWTSIPVLQSDDNGKSHPVGRILDDGSALILAEHLAGGFIRIKRAALQKFKDHYKDFIYYDASADPSAPDRCYTEFYTCERAPNEQGTPLRWGEDRVFGKRMKALGIEGYIFPKIHFGHFGVKGWMGNYDSYLRGEGQPVPEGTPAASAPAKGG